MLGEINAVAFKSGNAFLVKNGYEFFSVVPKICQWIAIAVVVYVLVRYAAFMLKGAPKNPANAK